MNLAARAWLIAFLLVGLLALSPATAQSGTSPEMVKAFGRAESPLAEVKRFKEFKAKAEKGDRSAQYNLGVCYSNGIGVAKDKVHAVSWYRAAAEQGIAEAQYKLGFCYDTGKGVTQNLVQAVSWFRKAAEQGHVQASNYLGVCYANGNGVAQDFVQAGWWYHKAAEQGDASDQYNLAQCYRRGKGVAKDEIEAYAFYNLAGETYEYARKDVANLEKEMSADQIAAGKKRTIQLQKEIEAKKAGK